MRVPQISGFLLSPSVLCTFHTDHTRRYSLYVWFRSQVPLSYVGLSLVFFTCTETTDVSYILDLLTQCTDNSSGTDRPTHGSRQRLSLKISRECSQVTATRIRVGQRLPWPVWSPTHRPWMVHEGWSLRLGFGKSPKKTLTTETEWMWVSVRTTFFFGFLGLYSCCWTLSFSLGLN